jgi:hypothetical protein
MDSVSRRFAGRRPSAPCLEDGRQPERRWTGDTVEFQALNALKCLNIQGVCSRSPAVGGYGRSLFAGDSLATAFDDRLQAAQAVILEAKSLQIRNFTGVDATPSSRLAFAASSRKTGSCLSGSQSDRQVCRASRVPHGRRRGNRSLQRDSRPLPTFPSSSYRCLDSSPTAL